MSGDLFPATLPEMIAEADREAKLRERVYPKMVAAGRLSNAAANRQLATMRAIRDYLAGLDHQNGNRKSG